MRRVICLALVSAFALAGCHHDHSSVPPAPVPTLALTPPKNLPGQAVIYVDNPKSIGTDDLLIARTVTLSHPESPARSAIEALLASKNTHIPAGTTLRGLTIENGLATLDFSRSPVSETGGEGGQGVALSSLGLTLGQFSEIEKFQIRVKGKLTTAFGEFTTDEPMAVTRPEKKL